MLESWSDGCVAGPGWGGLAYVRHGSVQKLDELPFSFLLCVPGFGDLNITVSLADLPDHHTNLLPQGLGLVLSPLGLLHHPVDDHLGLRHLPLHHVPLLLRLDHPHLRPLQLILGLARKKLLFIANKTIYLLFGRIEHMLSFL